MKNIRITGIDGNQSFDLVKDQVLSIDVKTLHIYSSQGSIWVTWPNGNERVLLEGQAMTVHTKGVICLQALSKSVVHITTIFLVKQNANRAESPSAAM